MFSLSPALWSILSYLSLFTFGSFLFSSFFFPFHFISFYLSIFFLSPFSFLRFLLLNACACLGTWTPFGDPNGPLDEHYTTVVKNTHAADGKSGRLDVGRRLGLHDTYSTSCTYNVVTDVDDQAYDNDSNGIGGGGSASFEWTQTSAHSFALAMHGGGSSSSSSLSGSPIAMRTVEVSCRFELNCCIGSTPPKPDGSLVRNLYLETFVCARARARSLSLSLSGHCCEGCRLNYNLQHSHLIFPNPPPVISHLICQD